MDIAKEISKGLADRIVIAKVNDSVWDLERPLEGNCSLELLDFEHPEGPLCSLSSSGGLLTLSQVRGCFGTRLRTSSERLLSVTTAAISALGRPLRMVFSTRWPSRIGSWRAI
jgi:hypothetical protein